jgi:hypothetical protein
VQLLVIADGRLLLVVIVQSVADESADGPCGRGWNLPRHVWVMSCGALTTVGGQRTGGLLWIVIGLATVQRDVVSFIIAVAEVETTIGVENMSDRPSIRKDIVKD